MKPIITISCLFLLLQTACGQMKQDIANYIEKYKSIALEEMVRCKIPASITLAQGLHESSYGKSKLSAEANNHFGIKCKDKWDGKKFYQNDDAPNECFRVYDHAEDSYADHSDFLVTRSRYAELFQLPITDYKAWAHGLKLCGYATNPKYAEILIKTIEDYNLPSFDQQGLAMVAEKEKQMQPLLTTDQPVQAKAEAPQTTVVVTPAKSSPAPEAKHTPFTKATSTAFVTVHEDATKKEFIVNGSKAIKAEGTIDPLAIAYNYQIQYAQVLAFNDINEGDKFKDGENIFLQTKRAKGGDPIYVVQPGESMHHISQKLGVKLKELYQKNAMALNDQPLAGETLYLQEKRPGPPKTMAYSDFLKSQASGNSSTPSLTASASTDNSVPIIAKQTYSSQYKVEPSDTLYSIAKKFNTTVQQLRALNNLDNTALHPGQTLVVGK
jgi:LysM repeat protein